MPPGLEEYWDGIRIGNTRGLLLLIDDTPAHWAFVMRESRTSTLLGFKRDAALLGNDFTVPGYRHIADCIRIRYACGCEKPGNGVPRRRSLKRQWTTIFQHAG